MNVIIVNVIDIKKEHDNYKEIRNKINILTTNKHIFSEEFFNTFSEYIVTEDDYYHGGEVS